MREYYLKILGISLFIFVLVGIPETMDAGLLMGLAVMWVMFSGFTNLICNAIPAIKTKAKTKSPIYRIKEIIENETYRIEKHEIVFERIDSLTCLFTLPFIWLFKFPVYEKVFCEDIEENNINSIEDLGEYVEKKIARQKELKRQEKEKKQPLERLNREFNENYFE